MCILIFLYWLKINLKQNIAQSFSGSFKCSAPSTKSHWVKLNSVTVCLVSSSMGVHCDPSPWLQRPNWAMAENISMILNPGCCCLTSLWYFCKAQVSTLDLESAPPGAGAANMSLKCWFFIFGVFFLNICQWLKILLLFFKIYGFYAPPKGLWNFSRKVESVYQ